MHMWLYRLLWLGLSPLVLAWLLVRLAKGKEEGQRFAERLGFASQPRPDGQLIWIHCASVGESLSVLPLVHALLNAEDTLNILVTTGTRTSAKLMAKQLPSRAIHQFVPLDIYPCVRRFLHLWHPDVSVFVESELWPELLHNAPNPVLINARMSQKSFQNYQKWQWFYAPLIQRFRAVLCQDTPDQQRLSTLGAANATVSGNLKFDALPLPTDPAIIKAFKKAIHAQPLLVLASTHKPEEMQLVSAIEQHLRPQMPDLLVIIAPRHPDRGANIAADIAPIIGHAPQLRSQNPELKPQTSYYIADTLGELGNWYQLADAVVIGGSFIPHGGQNPLEPLKLGAPVFCGPHMFNFKAITAALKAHNLLQQCADATTLATTLQDHLQQPKAKKQTTTLEHLTGATDRAKMALLDILKSEQ